jgi:hypothetical protein
MFRCIWDRSTVFAVNYIRKSLALLAQLNDLFSLGMTQMRCWVCLSMWGSHPDLSLLICMLYNVNYTPYFSLIFSQYGPYSLCGTSLLAYNFLESFQHSALCFLIAIEKNRGIYFILTNCLVRIFCHFDFPSVCTIILYYPHLKVHLHEIFYFWFFFIKSTHSVPWFIS